MSDFVVAILIALGSIVCVIMLLSFFALFRVSSEQERIAELHKAKQKKEKEEKNNE